MKWRFDSSYKQEVEWSASVKEVAESENDRMQKKVGSMR